MFNRTLKKSAMLDLYTRTQVCLGSDPDREQRQSFFEHIKTIRCHHVRGEGIPHSGNIREEAMPIGHSPCIWHTELGCIAFPRIIRLQMISSRDVYKIVGDAKLHRQTGLGLFVHAEYPNRSAGA